jgi:hypothetical protein
METILFEYTITETNKIQVLNNYALNIKQPLDKQHYTYDVLKKNVKIIEAIKQIRKELYINTKYKLKSSIKTLVNDYPYVLKNYLMSKKMVKFSISNAFTKLYEILDIFKDTIFKNNKLNSYHMAEAPGQWIKCVDFFIKNNKYSIEYNWFANSLNPKNQYNIEKYNIIFDDAYGLIKNNEDKWLYGADDTGNITVVDNILNIQKHMLDNNFKLDLITSDAGISLDGNSIEDLQKLDFAQLVNVLVLSSANTNIVIKTFLPFIINKKQSLEQEATDLFISIIYIYVIAFEKVYLYKPMTSGVTTGEFYIIGINYLNSIENHVKTKLIGYLSNFKYNMEIINKNTIPDLLKYQIYYFLNSVLELNIKYIDLENSFLKLINNNTITDLFISQLEQIKIEKIKFWLKHFHFIL